MDNSTLKEKICSLDQLISEVRPDAIKYNEQQILKWKENSRELYKPGARLFYQLPRLYLEYYRSSTKPSLFGGYNKRQFIDRYNTIFEGFFEKLEQEDINFNKESLSVNGKIDYNDNEVVGQANINFAALKSLLLKLKATAQFLEQKQRDHYNGFIQHISNHISDRPEFYFYINDTWELVWKKGYNPEDFIKQESVLQGAIKLEYAKYQQINDSHTDLLTQIELARQAWSQYYRHAYDIIDKQKRFQRDLVSQENKEQPLVLSERIRRNKAHLEYQQKIIEIINQRRSVDAKRIKQQLLNSLYDRVIVKEKMIDKKTFLMCIKKLCENTGKLTGSDTAKILAQQLTLQSNRDLYQYLLDGKDIQRQKIQNIRQRDLRAALSNDNDEVFNKYKTLNNTERQNYWTY